MRQLVWRRGKPFLTDGSAPRDILDWNYGLLETRRDGSDDVIVGQWLYDAHDELSAVRTFLRVPQVALEPTARVVAFAVPEAGDARRPAIVVDRVGRGMILAVLCDTWRWRGPTVSDGETTAHSRFWRQSLLRLAETRLLGRLVAEIGRAHV